MEEEGLLAFCQRTVALEKHSNGLFLHGAKEYVYLLDIAVQRNRHNSQNDINCDDYLWCSRAIFIAANPSLDGALGGKLAYLFRVGMTSVSRRWQFCPQKAAF